MSDRPKFRHAHSLAFQSPHIISAASCGLTSPCRLMWPPDMGAWLAWGQSAGIQRCGDQSPASDCPGRISLWIWLQAFYCSMGHDSLGTSQWKLSVTEGGRFRIHVCHPWCPASTGATHSIPWCCFYWRKTSVSLMSYSWHEFPLIKVKFTTHRLI